MSLLGRLSKLGLGCFRVRPIVPRQTVGTGAIYWSSCPVSVCLLSRYSTELPKTDLSVCYRYGRPVLSVPLPSRGEVCQFFIKPLLMTAGCFIRDIQTEDPGADTVALLNADGNRVSSTTLMDTVLDSDFQLIINNTSYNVHVPVRESHEHVTGLDDMKAVVQMLHAALHMPQHQLNTHTQLLKQLDDLTQKLAPMEKDRARLMSEAGSKASMLGWAGLAYMSLQGGLLAYITWWVSWDNSEPFSYFLTYSSSMVFFAYYILTKQDTLPGIRDRQLLHIFYQKGEVRTDRFNIDKYNQLKDQLAAVENDLKRLQKPIRSQANLKESHEHVTGLDDMKAVVQMLHAALHMPQHQLTTHTQLLKQLDDLTQKLAPMEKDRARLMSEAGSKASMLGWAGLAYMSLQGGFLAYLNWYVYAWDVMEAVTYFLTYSSSMMFFAYYILTKQATLPDSRDRQLLHIFNQKAKADGFNIDKYNQLKDQLAAVENDLKRLQKPIRLQLPLDQIQSTT